MALPLALLLSLAAPFGVHPANFSPSQSPRPSSFQLAQQGPGAEVQSCQLRARLWETGNIVSNVSTFATVLEGSVGNRSDQVISNVVVRYRIVRDRGSEAMGGRVNREVLDRSSRQVQGNRLPPYQSGEFRSNPKDFRNAPRTDNSSRSNVLNQPDFQGEILEVVWINRDGSRGGRRYDPPMVCSRTVDYR